MIRALTCVVLAAPLLAVAAAAEPTDAAVKPQVASIGSTSFCLYELPANGERQQWLNLSLVQYLELRAEELRIYYSGSTGSGEMRVALKQKQDGTAIIKKMQEAARTCR